jgi:hypothetical protein
MNACYIHLFNNKFQTHIPDILTFISYQQAQTNATIIFSSINTEKPLQILYQAEEKCFLLFS